MTTPTMEQPQRWMYSQDDAGLAIFNRELAAWHTHEIARLSAEVAELKLQVTIILRKLVKAGV